MKIIIFDCLYVRINYKSQLKIRVFVINVIFMIYIYADIEKQNTPYHAILIIVSRRT